jgi:hypothetical protein
MKYLKLFMPVIFVAGLVFYLSCRRVPDFRIEQSTEQKFFSVPDNTDPAVKRIVQKIFEQNQRYGFVNRLAKRAGYPAWNKNITVKSSPGSNILRGNGAQERSTLIFHLFLKRGLVRF